VKDLLMGFAVSTGTVLASALAGRYGLAGVLTALGALGMVLTFSGWLVTRPNTGSFKISPSGIEWTAVSEPSTPEPKEPKAKKRRHWLRRKPALRHEAWGGALLRVAWEPP
jgi:hypothetical protein